MSKHVQLTIDKGAFLDEIIENTSLVVWNSTMRSFAFAHYLNQLFKLNLQRVDNVNVLVAKKEVDCIVYRFADTSHKLYYFLICTQQDAHGEIYFDKTLIVKGYYSAQRCHHIYEIMHADTAPTSAIPSLNETLLAELNSTNSILQCAVFDFTDPDNPATNYFTPAPAGSQRQAKQMHFLNRQMEYTIDLMMSLDDLMPGFDDE